MGARGPKPKPNALKVLAGTRKDRINTAAPAPPPATPDPPPELTPAAAKEWARITAELATLRVLTAADRAALQTYCEAFAQWSEATARIKKTGLVTRTAAGGLRASPYVGIAAAASATMLRILAEIGGTPSARGRMKTATESTAGDPAAELLDFLQSG